MGTSVLFIQCYRSYFNHKNGGNGNDGPFGGTDCGNGSANNGRSGDSGSGRAHFECHEQRVDPLLFGISKHWWLGIQPLLHLSPSAAERERVYGVFGSAPRIGYTL